VMGISGIVAGLSARLRRWQSGFVRSYALTMIAGAFVIGFVLVLGRLG
jgi:NADH-quinone oxidoreductase subunit L